MLIFRGFTAMKFILGLTQSDEEMDPKFAVTVPEEHGSQDAWEDFPLYVP